MHSAPELEKRVWTQHDFDQMGWHDVQVHALGMTPERFELKFDLDYILRWVDPEPPSKFFSFWIAPATLVFENVRQFQAKLGPECTQLEIIDISRDDVQPVPQGPTPWGSAIEGPEWRWALEMDGGELSFRSTGFRQFFRSAPRHCATRQHLTLEERGGVSFGRDWRD